MKNDSYIDAGRGVTGVFSIFAGLACAVTGYFCRPSFVLAVHEKLGIPREKWPTTSAGACYALFGLGAILVVIGIVCLITSHNCRPDVDADGRVSGGGPLLSDTALFSIIGLFVVVVGVLCLTNKVEALGIWLLLVGLFVMLSGFLFSDKGQGKRQHDMQEIGHTWYQQRRTERSSSAVYETRVTVRKVRRRK